LIISSGSTITGCGSLTTCLDLRQSQSDKSSVTSTYLHPTEKGFHCWTAVNIITYTKVALFSIVIASSRQQK